MHDEFGNIDPIKASQTPVPRAYSASKRARPESDTDQSSKRIKREGDNADDHLRDSFTWEDRQDTYSAEAEPDATTFGSPLNTLDHVLDPSLMDVDDEICGPGLDSHATNSGGSAIEDDLPPASLQPQDVQGHHPAHRDESLPPDVHEQSIAVMPNVELASSALEGLRGHKLTDVPGIDPPPPDVEEQSPDLASAADNGPVNGQRSPHGAPPGNAGPVRGSSSENRSRTPSLRLQTNSCESNAASGSVPSSPLTELEPSSPVAPQKSMEDVSEEVTETVWHAGTGPQGKTDAFTTPKVSRRSSQRTPTSNIPVQAKSSKKTPGSNSTRKQSSARGVSAGSRTSPLDTHSSPIASSLEEDASMKLIRQMQEQEFGLRRRS